MDKEIAAKFLTVSLNLSDLVLSYLVPIIKQVGAVTIGLGFRK